MFLARQHLVEDKDKEADLNRDWLLSHSPYSYIILAGVLGSILLSCIYFLYRGPYRRTFPCFPSRRNQSDRRQSKRKDEGDLTEWRNAQKRSANIIAEMQLEWETEKRLRESVENGRKTARQITKPTHSTVSGGLKFSSQQSLIDTPNYADHFRAQPNRSAQYPGYTVSYAPTISSFGHNTTSSGLAFDLPFPPAAVQHGPASYNSAYGPAQSQSPVQGNTPPLPGYPSPVTPLPTYSVYAAQPYSPIVGHDAQYNPAAFYSQAPTLAFPLSIALPSTTYQLINDPHTYSTVHPHQQSDSFEDLGTAEHIPDFSRPRCSPDEVVCVNPGKRQTVFSSASVYSQATIPMPAPIPTKANHAPISMITTGRSPTGSYYSSGSTSSGSRPRSSSLSHPRSNTTSQSTISHLSSSSDGRHQSTDCPRKSILKQPSSQMPSPQLGRKRRSSTTLGRVSVRSIGKGHDIAPSPLRQSVSTVG